MNKAHLLHAVKLFFVYALLWLILSGGVFDLFALLAVLILSFSTPFVFSLGAKLPNLKAVVILLGFFIFNSVKGALQVSKLALMPKHCLTPFIYELELDSKVEFTQVMLANIYSLMPGTVSMGLSKNKLTLHILDQTLFDEPFLQTVQIKVIEALEHNR